MNLYRLKWPDGITAAAAVYFVGAEILSLNISGEKTRLTVLTSIKCPKAFDDTIKSLAREQNAELLVRLT